MNQKGYEESQKRLICISLAKGVSMTLPEGWGEVILVWSLRKNELEQECNKFENGHPNFDYGNYKADLRESIADYLGTKKPLENLDLQKLKTFQTN